VKKSRSAVFHAVRWAEQLDDLSVARKRRRAVLESARKTERRVIRRSLIRGAA
jgi:hypothetical protein